MKNVKELICNELISIQSKKIKSLELLINSTKESRDTANKSSAGDKHETSRAKIQTEIDNYTKQLNLALKNLHTLKKLDNLKKHTLATQGSLITSDNGIFFISIGVGKFEIRSNNYFIISLPSPIGTAMKGLAKGEKFTFKGIKYSIKNIE